MGGQCVTFTRTAENDLPLPAPRRQPRGTFVVDLREALAAARAGGRSRSEGGSALTLRVVRIGEPANGPVAWTMPVRARDDVACGPAW